MRTEVGRSGEARRGRRWWVGRVTFVFRLRGTETRAPRGEAREAVVQRGGAGGAGERVRVRWGGAGLVLNNRCALQTGGYRLLTSRGCEVQCGALVRGGGVQQMRHILCAVRWAGKAARARGARGACANAGKAACYTHARRLVSRLGHTCPVTVSAVGSARAPFSLSFPFLPFVLSFCDSPRGRAERTHVSVASSVCAGGLGSGSRAPGAWTLGSVFRLRGGDRSRRCVRGGGAARRDEDDGGVARLAPVVQESRCACVAKGGTASV
jgi:hypothetical protein